ncbi:MAG TPA: penicillin-binding protein activator LpoB [Phycisphaerales bacterium]|nr:penicillin-binding protein activator LpoB [Phycisphaerales bacterium]|tara:strand:- start:940 stop:1578 length:639 start_codon:yes stop_codon:yes gene_type:complete
MKMTFNKTCIALGLCGLMLTGCESTRAKRIDPAGTQTITTIKRLDIQDAADAAAAMSQSLLESGRLGKHVNAAGETVLRPSVIAIDRYVNNTSQQIDRDEVLKKIRVALNKAGVAQTIVTINDQGDLGGESNIASKFARENTPADRSVQTPELLVVDYSLTFKIIENRAQAGQIRQTTFTFQMSLVDVKTGLAVWEDEKQITKQGKDSSVGW